MTCWAPLKAGLLLKVNPYTLHTQHAALDACLHVESPIIKSSQALNLPGPVGILHTVVVMG